MEKIVREYKDLCASYGETPRYSADDIPDIDHMEYLQDLEDLNPTQYEVDTWYGRKNVEAEELGKNYFCSVNLAGHISQLRNPDSWVHSHKEKWFKASKELPAEPLISAEDIEGIVMTSDVVNIEDSFNDKELSIISEAIHLMMKKLEQDVLPTFTEYFHDLEDKQLQGVKKDIHLLSTISRRISKHV